MDPNATAHIMRDTAADLDDRIDAAHHLLGWLNAGGFPPDVPDADGTPRVFNTDVEHVVIARSEAMTFAVELTAAQLAATP